MTKSVLTFDYMTGFRCIGPDCEDSCCTGWQVNLYQEDYYKIRGLHEEQGKLAFFDDAVQLPPEDQRRPDNFGNLEFGEKARCCFLDQGWCALQRDHGETMLPRVCATFPRAFYNLDDRLEMHGLLACPEVARLCLLSEKEPEIIEIDEEGIPTFFEYTTYTAGSPDIYEQYRDVVAKTVRWVLGRRETPMAERLFQVLYLSMELEAFYFKDMKEDPGPKLEALVRNITNAEFTNDLIQQFHGGGGMQPIIRQVVLAIAAAPLQGARFRRFQMLSVPIILSYGELGEHLMKTHDLNVSEQNRIWDEYEVRKAKVLDKAGERVNQYFSNYAANYWQQGMFHGNTALSDHMRKFLMSIAAMKFMFFSHPEVQQAVQQGGDDMNEVLDRVVVDVVQIFMKNIDTNALLIGKLIQTLDNVELTSLNELGMFLKV